MRGKLRPVIGPVYLLLCLLVGGSTRGVWGNMVLQLIAVALIAWASLAAPRAPLSPAAHRLGWLVASLAGLVALQLVPLPPALWGNLPGRSPIAEGLRLLDVRSAWFPISLTPYDTIVSAQWLLPPIAMLAIIIRLGAYRAKWIGGVILLAALSGLLLGILQRSSGDPLHSRFYPYAFSNFGQATGFFANSNHMAALLVVAIPFVAAIAGQVERRRGAARLRASVIAVGLLLIMTGLLLNNSLAALGLAVPVIGASAALVIPRPQRWARWALPGVALLLILSVAAIFLSPAQNNLTGSGAAQSFESRRTTFARTIEAAADHAPLGSGLGSFAALYPRYENAGETSLFFVNHAHSDPLEWALEMGLPGILLIVALLWWWTVQTLAIWRAPTLDKFAGAATIALALLMAHSLVDFPLRTSALAAVFAACLALMVRPPRGVVVEPGAPPGSRHWRVG